jgi:hypothetical protein
MKNKVDVNEDLKVIQEEREGKTDVEILTEVQLQYYTEYVQSSAVSHEEGVLIRSKLPDVVSKTWEKLTFLDLCSIQPMKSPASLVFFLNYVFNAVTMLDENEIQSRVKKHTEFYTKIIEGLKDANAISASMDLLTPADYEAKLRKESKMPDIMLELTSAPVVAQPKTCLQSPIFKWDWSNQYITEVLSEAISRALNDWMWKEFYATDEQVTCSLDSLSVATVKASTRLHENTLRYVHDILIVSSDLKEGYDWSQYEPRYEVRFDDKAPEKTVLAAAKSKSLLDGGMIYSPYIMLASFGIESSEWDLSRPIMTRSARHGGTISGNLCTRFDII